MFLSDVQIFAFTAFTVPYKLHLVRSTGEIHRSLQVSAMFLIIAWVVFA